MSARTCRQIKELLVKTIQFCQKMCRAKVTRIQCKKIEVK